MTGQILPTLRYDPQTGEFTDPTRRRKVGWINQDGYISITCGGLTRTAHRWAWFLHYGKWPDLQIDHINGNKTDNRIENLREVDGSTNAQNQRRAMSTNKLGILGVTASRNKFRADITVDGKAIFLGRFGTKEEAQSVYLNAKRQMHRGCTI